MINRNIYVNPAMQQAYLNYLKRAKSAGYVNPQRRASKSISASTRAETQRLQSLDEAAENRKFVSKRHQEQLNLIKDELRSREEARGISTILGAGQIGLGLLDARKTKKASQKMRQDRIGSLKLQLDYMKKYNPKQYEWYTSQPMIKRKLKEFNITLD